MVSLVTPVSTFEARGLAQPRCLAYEGKLQGKRVMIIDDALAFSCCFEKQETQRGRERAGVREREDAEGPID